MTIVCVWNELSISSNQHYNGQFDFIIKSQEQWWYGFISAQIMSWWAELGWQKPGTKDIVVKIKFGQKKT